MAMKKELYTPSKEVPSGYKTLCFDRIEMIQVVCWDSAKLQQHRRWVFLRRHQDCALFFDGSWV